MAYIDKDKLLKDIEESVVFTVRGQNSLEIKGANKITDRIKQMPTADVVEVVRCKDCIYKHTAESIPLTYCKALSSGIIRPVLIEDNDFCSYGKRKEVD